MNRHRFNWLMAERLAIVVFSAGAAAAIFYYDVLPDAVTSQGKAFPVVSTLSALYASLLGFIVAITIFLLGLVETENFKVLRASASYVELWAIFKGAMIALGTGAGLGIVSVLWMWVDALSTFVVWLFICTTFWILIRLFRIVWVLHLIIDAEIAQGANSREKLNR